MIVTIQAQPTDRFPGQTGFVASIIDGPEWMIHQTETASIAFFACERLATRLADLYSHRADFVVHKA